MDERRWARVREIFHTALEVEPSRRDAFLFEACDDEPLRREVESLLASAPQAEAYLEDLAFRVGAPRPTSPLQELSGTRIGHYRVLQPLGRGGMGAVYLAERADAQFEKTVALKLLPLGMAGPDDHHLFLRERQVLARLEHPGIARLLDGGVTDDGTPYFVMEYIKGTPIVEYCEAHGLSEGERLELFIRVCDAVEYAHRNLVIHRDLKSDNILVTEEGEAKLLDFGIARMIAEQEGRHDTATVAGRRRMTPSTASPEQVRNEAVATTTDVYSLGVVLYRLLAGRPPYEITGDTSPARIERIVCEEVPEPPSRANWRLSGDLDAIVLTALRKEPGERYQSVRELADDLQRHLHDLPVQARRDDRWYRVSRFVRRNRLAVGAGAVLAVLLLAIVGISVRHIVVTDRQATALQAERDVARRQAARAQRVTDLLVDLFEDFDPAVERGDTLTAEALLRRGMERVSELPDEPDLRAEILTAIGDAYRKLGLYDEAEVALDEAVAQRRRTGPAGRHELAVALTSLAESRNGSQAFALAEPPFREALAIQDELLRDQGHDTALVLERSATLIGLAAGLRNLGKADSAVLLLREVVDTRLRYGRGGDRETLVAMGTLAYALRGAGEAAEAEALYRRVLDGQRALGEGASLSLAKTLNDLAYLLRTQEDFAGAVPLYQESLDIVRNLLGEAHPTTLLVMNNLASVLDHGGEVNAAEEILRRRVALERAHNPPGHWRLGAALGALGTHLLRFRGDPGAALEPMRERLAVYRGTLGDGHDWTAEARVGVGECLLRLDRLEEAEPLLLEGRARLAEVEGPEGQRTRGVGALLVELYERWGRPDRAEPYREPGGRL